MTEIKEWQHRGQRYVTRDTLTVSEARGILERAAECGLDGMSTINKSLTKQQVYDIFVNAMVDSPDDELLPSLVARNIKREFGEED